MDFGDIVILLILLAPLLRRLFGKKQQPAPPPSGEGIESQPALSSPGADPLAEALRQIREALAEPEPAAAPPPPARKPTKPKKTREPEFHALGAFEHDEHGFGKSNPISEEMFERRPVGQSRTPQPPQKVLDKVDLRTPIEVSRDSESSASDYTRMLTDPTRLQEAFVMKEILDPPRSKHRGR